MFKGRWLSTQHGVLRPERTWCKAPRAIVDERGRCQNQNRSAIPCRAYSLSIMRLPSSCRHQLHRPIKRGLETASELCAQSRFFDATLAQSRRDARDQTVRRVPRLTLAFARRVGSVGQPPERGTARLAVRSNCCIGPGKRWPPSTRLRLRAFCSRGHLGRGANLSGSTRELS
jgi:hypothetical protein